MFLSGALHDQRVTKVQPHQLAYLGVCVVLPVTKDCKADDQAIRRCGCVHGPAIAWWRGQALNGLNSEHYSYHLT